MTFKQQLDGFYNFLDRPLFMSARVVLALLVIPLALAFTEPLWRISLRAPQYPDGLWMDIYTHKVDGGNKGQHIAEINTLNHYIGMHRIDRAELSDLDWIPFAIGLLIVLALRCAVIGNIRTLIDLVVLTGYVSIFAFGRFVYKLYVFGHNLDPTAPLKIEPFTPAIFGTKQIANFTTTSTPQLGSLYVGVFATGTAVLLVWHLVAGRLAMLRATRAEQVTAP
jgi:copper chaperone NosL